MINLKSEKTGDIIVGVETAYRILVSEGIDCEYREIRQTLAIELQDSTVLIKPHHIVIVRDSVIDSTVYDITDSNTLISILEGYIQITVDGFTVACN